LTVALRVGALKGSDGAFHHHYVPGSRCYEELAEIGLRLAAPDAGGPGITQVSAPAEDSSQLPRTRKLTARIALAARFATAFIRWLLGLL